MPDLFNSLPDGAKAAVIGVVGTLVAAALAIVGVVISNVVSSRNTTRQLEQDRNKHADQLSHDREQKSAERELALRKEVYLGAAENLYAGMTMLGFIADPNQTMYQLMTTWRSSQHFLGKLHLLAGPELMAATTEANFALAQTLLLVSPLRGRLEAVKQKQVILQKMIDSRHAGSDAALEYLSQRQLAGQDTKEEALRIMGVGRQHVESAKELSAKQDALYAELLSIQRLIFSTVINAQVGLLRQFVPVIEAARAELNVAFDAEAYERLMKRSEEHAKLMVQAIAPTAAQS
jgi:hypothetical protein